MKILFGILGAILWFWVPILLSGPILKLLGASTNYVGEINSIVGWFPMITSPIGFLAGWRFGRSVKGNFEELVKRMFVAALGLLGLSLLLTVANLTYITWGFTDLR